MTNAVVLCTIQSDVMDHAKLSGLLLYFHAVIICSFFVFFFPRLISAAADWMSAILPHMVWP